MQQIRCINCMKEIAPGTRICPHCGYDQQTEQLSYVLRPNTILHGRYFVGRVIGKGGFGITYVGFDLMLEVKVAIKEYYPSGIASRNNSWSNQVVWESRNQGYGAGQNQHYESGQNQGYGADRNQGCGSNQDARIRRQESMERVLKEARRTAKLSKVSAVVQVNDVFQENETAYIVMEFIEGITLKDYLAKHGVMTWEECQKLLFPVMEALAQAHDIGIVHRDISPDNIMIELDGEAKLLDLGAAMDIDANSGQASTLVVKSHFSPMEQYDENGKIGSWTDVYAFAATLYYCLTGKLMMPVLDRLRNSEITFSNERNIPEEVKAALCRALAIYEDERTQDMREFQRELSQDIYGTKPRTETTNNSERFSPDLVVIHSMVDHETLYDFLIRDRRVNFSSVILGFMTWACSAPSFERMGLSDLMLFCILPLLFFAVWQGIFRFSSRIRSGKMIEKGDQPASCGTYVLTPDRIEMIQSGGNVSIINWSDIIKVISTKYAIVLYATPKEISPKGTTIDYRCAYILTTEGLDSVKMNYLCTLIRRYAYNAKPVKLKY